MKILAIPALLLLQAFPAAASCFPVTGDMITGHHLALADSRFAAVPATFVAAPAPVPGTTRVLAVAELLRIARANGIPMHDVADLCFEVPLRQIGDDEMMAAFQRSLKAVRNSEAQVAEVQVAMVERSKAPVPDGKVEFSLQGLLPASPSEPDVQLWRGYVKQSESRKTAIWARVRITQTLTAVVAARDLPPNVAIDASALSVIRWTGPLQREEIAVKPEDAAGQLPKRAVKAGLPIPLSSLIAPLAVHRGEAVKVEVHSGLARLQMDAIAEREGRNGEMVEFRNMASGKVFRARVDGSKAVLMIAGGSKE